MTKVTEATEELEDLGPVKAVKTRLCLRCSDTFESIWAGNRICPRCKSSGTWRAGVSYSAPTGSGRS